MRLAAGCHGLETMPTLILLPRLCAYSPTPVSYTHLDVYKRQDFVPLKGVENEVIELLVLPNPVRDPRSRHQHTQFKHCRPLHFVFVKYLYHPKLTLNGLVFRFCVTAVSYTHLVPIACA